MKIQVYSFLLLLLLHACGKKQETTKPVREAITSSVYASGTVKAKHQYQVYTKANGTILEWLVNDGDAVNKGQVIMRISNNTSQINKANAALAAQLNNTEANKIKLAELKANIDFARTKYLNDSLALKRQQSLWEQNVGSKVDLEQRELAYQNSKTIVQTSILKYNDLKKQLDFLAAQSKNNLQLSEEVLSDFEVRSEVTGKIYAILKEVGEMVTPNAPLAVIGSANEFTIELQVDEYDVVKIKPGMKVYVSMDSYKGEVFEAVIKRINPYMNERTKTFTVESEFTKAPQVLYPNLSVEVNIFIETKTQVLTLPRSAVSEDNMVTLADGTQQKVTTGLKDYKKVEIISGLSETDEVMLVKP